MPANYGTEYISEFMHRVGLLGIVPPQGCESILIEMLQPKRYYLCEKTLWLVTKQWVKLTIRYV